MRKGTKLPDPFVFLGKGYVWAETGSPPVNAFRIVPDRNGIVQMQGIDSSGFPLKRSGIGIRISEMDRLCLTWLQRRGFLCHDRTLKEVLDEIGVEQL